jgi:hypothetical protein
MSNYRDIESSYLVGRAKFEAWRDQWEREFLEPLVEDLVRIELAKTITPDMMRELAVRDEKTFKGLVEFLGAGGG